MPQEPEGTRPKLFLSYGRLDAADLADRLCVDLAAYGYEVWRDTRQIRMQAWQDSEDQYQAGLTRLLDALEAARRGEVRYRSWEHDLRPWDFAPFLHEKRRRFCGREWLFDEIDAWRVSSREPALLYTLTLEGNP